jgi:hypothetical protein
MKFFLIDSSLAERRKALRLKWIVVLQGTGSKRPFYHGPQGRSRKVDAGKAERFATPFYSSSSTDHFDANNNCKDVRCAPDTNDQKYIEAGDAAELRLPANASG